MRQLVQSLGPPLASRMDASVVRNHAGGLSIAVDCWTRLDRFLILGSSQPTYYASARAVTIEAAEAAVACLAEDGPRAIDQLVAVSVAGRAPSNEPALFALALALKLGDPATRRRAREALPAVARTLAGLYRFARAVDALGGWGRGTRRAFQDWLTGRPARALATQAIKYRQRDDWTLRDLLRMSHVRAPNAALDALFAWSVRGSDIAGFDELSQIAAFERARTSTDVAEIVRLIVEHDLPREAIPTQFLQHRAVWEALLVRMPMTAMIRSLGKLSAVGLLTRNSDAERTVAERLTTLPALKAARVHPLALLVAKHTYGLGHGLKGALAWSPVPTISAALERAFYLAFDAVEPSGTRTMLALDVSGSMTYAGIAGLSGLTPRVASAAMAMVTARSEPDARFMAFSSTFVPLPIARDDRLDAVIAKVDGLPFGGTDCAQPMLYAAAHRIPVDTFVIYTDSETWFGDVHPWRALEDYRERTGIPAKLVVVGMVSNGFSLARPGDAGMLDVVGFDTAAPRVIADFGQQRAGDGTSASVHDPRRAR